MNDCTFYLDAPLLKAALLFVANEKDSRERLRCVHVYSNGPTVITESTNGHAALIGRNTYEDGAFRGPGVEGGLNVSINAIDVKAALDTGDGNLVPLVARDGVWALGGHQFTPFAEEYPNLARVVPQTCSGQIAQFDPKYLSMFERAAKLLRKRNKGTSFIHVAHNGAHAAIINIDTHSAFGLLMPRFNVPFMGVPSWYVRLPGGTK